MNVSNAHFADPYFFLLLLALPLYWGWYFFFYGSRRPSIRLSIDMAKKQSAARNFFSLLRFLPTLLAQAAFICMVAALARPQTTQGFANGSVEGVDLMLVFDVSGSMESHDLPPDRLSVAKEAAIRMVNKLTGDRVGVTVFSQDAFCFVPLTLDYDFVKRQIADISTDFLPKDGTALGSAIAAGINRLRESPSPAKIMVLFTDGASNTGRLDPLTAARLAAEHKVVVYPIAVGLKSIDTVRSHGGSFTESHFDEKTLEKIANLTGGDFFRVTQPKALDGVLKHIARLEKSRFPIQEYRMAHDVYTPYLIAALAFLFGSLVLRYLYIYNPLED